jgi:hypothetical protein
MWMKYRHKFANGPGEWEWQDLGSVRPAEVPGTVASVRTELESEYDSELYRGIQHELVDLPPIEVLKEELRQAEIVVRRGKARVSDLHDMLISACVKAQTDGKPPEDR